MSPRRHPTSGSAGNQQTKARTGGEVHSAIGQSGSGIVLKKSGKPAGAAEIGQFGTQPLPGTNSPAAGRLCIRKPRRRAPTGPEKQHDEFLHGRQANPVCPALKFCTDSLRDAENTPISQGQLLLDGGKLGSCFHRTVVLVCQHNAEGAFGLILNQPSDNKVGDVLEADLPEAA